MLLLLDKGYWWAAIAPAMMFILLIPYTMDSCMDDRGLLCRVSPFGHPRIKGYLLLPAAFRSLSRPSSALSAKASALRSFCLTICCYSVNSLAFFPLDDNLSSMSSYSSVVILSDNYGVFQGFISHVCNFQGTSFSSSSC